MPVAASFFDRGRHHRSTAQEGLGGLSIAIPESPGRRASEDSARRRWGGAAGAARADDDDLDADRPVHERAGRAKTQGSMTAQPAALHAMWHPTCLQVGALVAAPRHDPMEVAAMNAHRLAIPKKACGRARSQSRAG